MMLLRFFLVILYVGSISSLAANELISPLPISPFSQQVFNETPKSYIWKKVADTIRYDFYLFDRKTLSLVYRDENIPQCLTEHCSYNIPNSIKLLNWNDHVWRVRAVTNMGTTDFSYIAFNIKEELSIPTTVSPQNNAEIPFLNKPISFAWKKDNNATHYDFYIYDRNLKKAIYRNTFVSPQCKFQDICVFSPPKEIIVSKGKEHVWRVRSINSSNNSSSNWSYSLFTIANNFSNIELQAYLSSPLWNKENAYDAGHFGMLPLHASFALNEHKSLRTLFRLQFKSFLTSSGENELEALGNLAAYHYYYLMSQYMVLSEKSDLMEDKLENREIKKVLCNKITSYWLNEPAWQYGAPSFENMSKRTEWKLNVDEKTLAYPFYRGIFDEELFFFAIAHDLNQISSYGDCPVVSDILESTYQVISQRSEFTSVGGWLFDSIWGEHPYSKYAGYSNMSSVIENQPIPVPSIAWDSSHFHRFPLWLKSFKDAYPENDSRQAFYQEIINKLAVQFKAKVIINNGSNWFYTNYMDGWNGVFRYSFIDGQAQGVDPYELSATPLLGWWYFLNDKDINTTYCLISNNFPLNNKTKKTYVGLNSGRKRNPLVTLPGSLNQGAILQTIPQQACHMGKTND